MRYHCVSVCSLKYISPSTIIPRIYQISWGNINSSHHLCGLENKHNILQSPHAPKANKAIMKNALNISIWNSVTKSEKNIDIFCKIFQLCKNESLFLSVLSEIKPISISGNVIQEKNFASRQLSFFTSYRCILSPWLSARFNAP